MNEPRKVTVADLVRYHRHLSRAVAAGFAANATGIEEYKQALRVRRRSRRGVTVRRGEPYIVYEYDPARIQAEMSLQLTRPGHCIPVNLSNVNDTATGAMITGTVLGNALQAFGGIGALIARR